MKENRKYAGEFSITHGMSTTTFEVSVEDKLSGARFVQFTMEAEDLMLALTGQSNLRCEFELRGLDLVGKQHQAKRVLIPQIDSFMRDDAFLAVIDAVRPSLETDGWEMDEQVHFNQHMLRGHYEKGPRGYEVILRRYVEVPDEDEGSSTTED